MTQKLFTRFRTRKSIQRVVAETFTEASCRTEASESPAYEVIDPNPDSGRSDRIPLIRTVSDSSNYSSSSQTWLDSIEDVSQTQEEQLPAYCEPTPLKLRPMVQYVIPQPRRAPHTLCPCAECHRLR